MSGKVHSMPRVSMPLRRVALFLYLLAASAVPIPAAQAAGGEEQNVKINIGKLQHEIKIHLDKIRQSGEEEVSVLDELARINSQLQKKQDKINNLQKRLAAQINLVELKEEELEQAAGKRDNLQRHMQKRLRSFYLMGKIGLLNVTFSKNTLPELMLFTDSYQRLISYDQSVFDMYRETVLELQRTKVARELEKSLLEEFIIQAKDEKSEILALSKEQKRLLYRITTERGLYVQAINEMRRAEYNLAHTLSILKERDDFKKRGFLLGRGTFPPPVPGTLAQQFGETVREGFKKGDTVLGITIETDGEVPVRAIYAGKVIFAGYKRGYGNTVIIDHGLNYYSITSRLDIVAAEEGALIETGDQIGITGDMATLFERGLYFEVRHKAKPLDPLTWLHPLAFASDRDLEAIHETWNSQDDEIIIVEETMPEAESVPQTVVEVESQTEPVKESGQITEAEVKVKVEIVKKPTLAEDVAQEGDIQLATEVKADNEQDTVATKAADEPEEEIGFFQSIGNALFGADTEPEPELELEPEEDTSPKPATEVTTEIAAEVGQSAVVVLETEVEQDADNKQQDAVAIEPEPEPEADSEQQGNVALETEVELEVDSDQQDGVAIKTEAEPETDNDQQDAVVIESQVEPETDKQDEPKEEIGFFQSIGNAIFGENTEPEPDFEQEPEEDTIPKKAVEEEPDFDRQEVVELETEAELELNKDQQDVIEIEPEVDNDAAIEIASEAEPEAEPKVDNDQQDAVEVETEVEPKTDKEIFPVEETTPEQDNERQTAIIEIIQQEIKKKPAPIEDTEDTDPEGNVVLEPKTENGDEQPVRTETKEETGFFQSIGNAIFGSEIELESEPAPEEDINPSPSLPVEIEINRQNDVSPDIEAVPEPESEVIPVEEIAPEVDREQQADLEKDTVTEPFKETVLMPVPVLEDGAKVAVDPPDENSQPVDIETEDEVKQDTVQQDAVETDTHAATENAPRDNVEVKTEVTGTEDDDQQGKTEIEAAAEPEEKTGFFSSLSASIFGSDTEEEPESDHNRQPDVALDPLADVELNSAEEPEKETPQKPETRKKKKKSFFENDDYL